LRGSGVLPLSVSPLRLLLGFDLLLGIFPLLLLLEFSSVLGDTLYLAGWAFDSRLEIPVGVNWALFDMALLFTAGPVHGLMATWAKHISMSAFLKKYIINLIGESALITNGGCEALLKRFN
jgi:hypothetical protein